MRVSLPFVFLILFSLSAHARLGETQDQIETRFGKPNSGGSYNLQLVNEKCYVLFFTKTGFAINIMLLNDISIAEEYVKITGDKITDEEKRKLLSLNSSGQKWQFSGPRSINNEVLWVRNDKATATLFNNLNNIQFLSKEYLDAQAEAIKKAHFSSVDGF